MCVIIAKNAGVKPLDMEYFDRAWNRNPDGAGVVFYDPKKDCAYIKKGMMKKEDALSFIEKINREDVSFIAHFRIKSKGAVCPANTHPFNYENITFAHNGTLSINPTGNETDTEAFGNRFFVDRDLDWIKDNKDLLEYAIGSSKFAVMDNDTGEIVILNEQLGKEEEGCWFSNSSAMPATPIKSYTCSTLLEEATKEDMFSDKWRPSDVRATYNKEQDAWMSGAYGGTLYVNGSRGNVHYNKRGFIVLDNVNVPADADRKEPWSQTDVESVLEFFQTEIEQELSYRDTGYVDKDSVYAMYLIYDTIKRLNKNGEIISLGVLDALLFDKGFSYQSSHPIDTELDSYREAILQALVDNSAREANVNDILAETTI